MSLAYPPGPAALPPNLTAPSAAYKRHAWLAMLGLTVFIALYFALAGWFAWTAWRLFAACSRMATIDLWGFVAGMCSAFLAVFMWKALVFVKHRARDRRHRGHARRAAAAVRVHQSTGG